MDLEAARKSLSKRSALSTKKIAFIAAAGLVLVAGIGLRAGHYFGEPPAAGEPTAVETATPTPEPAPASTPEAAPPPPPATTTESVPKTPPATQQAAPAPETPPVTQQAAPAPAPSEPTDQVSEPEANATEQNDQADLPGSGMILVARKPVEVLASPSASAPAMYGFPAGRPFRVIGREGGFVHIQDLRSSASGWIDETALAAPPASRAPSVAAPSQAKPTAVGRKPATASADPKPKAAKKSAGAPVAAGSEPAPQPDSAQARRPPGLFGRGGFFGGGN